MAFGYPGTQLIETPYEYTEYTEYYIPTAAAPSQGRRRPVIYIAAPLPATEMPLGGGFGSPFGAPYGGGFRMF